MAFLEGECGYFDGLTSNEDYVSIPSLEEARTVFEDLPDYVTAEHAQKAYVTILTQQGYRRSCSSMYKNVCTECGKCLSIRIPVARFAPTKSQRRILRLNEDIKFKTSVTRSDMLSDEKIQLYRKYSLKHNEFMFSESKARLELEHWNGFFPDDESPFYCGTINIDYYLNDKLVGCSVMDVLDDGVSSVYFYYDISSEIMKRSLGTFSILKEIEVLRDMDPDSYYYLGYYIKDCPKMSYKANFSPHELLSNTAEEWVENS